MKQGDPMITKKDLESMPLYKPFWGPAEAPPNVQWDIFWAHTCDVCDLEPFSRLDWDIVEHPEGGGGYPEPEIDHEAQDEAIERGLIKVAGGYDDDDACLAALNEGFTLVKVAYGKPGDRHYRILVCARNDNPSPKYAREKREDEIQRDAFNSDEPAPVRQFEQVCRAKEAHLVHSDTRGVKTPEVSSMKEEIEKAVDEINEKAETVFVVVEANSVDEFADNAPTIGIIEFTPALVAEIDRMSALRQLLPEGAVISLRTGSCLFFDHTLLEPDFEIDFGETDVSQGVVIEDPGDQIMEHQVSTNWDRIEIEPHGVRFESGPKHASGVVETNILSYERLEELLKPAP